MLFDDVLDDAGNILSFNNDFFGYAISLNFNITDRLGIKASMFDAFDNDALKRQSNIAFTYQFFSNTSGI